MTNQTKSNICRTANYLVKQGHSRSEAFRLAWVLAKGTTTAVAGVSFGKRPRALERLTTYRKEEISINLEREEQNPYDASAVQVWASVEGKGRYCMGYIPKAAAPIMAAVMEAGTPIRSTLGGIVGGWKPGQNLGMRITLAI
jgi:hypothetical protein